MMEAGPGKTVVLGLGNVLHADDGAGAQAIKRLREDLRVPADVILVEGGTLGLELLSYVWDCSRLIVIDAVDVGEAPGTVVRMGRNGPRYSAGALGLGSQVSRCEGPPAM